MALMSLNGTMTCTHEGVTYEAQVKWDDEARLFHGDVINLRDVITFQGRSVDELEKAFKDSVVEYLSFCAETGAKPEKPCSGRFLVRVTPHVHRLISKAARQQGQSLNAWVATTLERCVIRE